jgi:hypothetical protein
MPPLAIPRAERPGRVNTFCKKWAPLFVVDTPETGAIPVSKNREKPAKNSGDQEVSTGNLTRGPSSTGE